MRRVNRFSLVSVVLALCGLGGCAERKENKVPVYPVEGKLIVSGILAANAQLAFHPVDASASRGICPVGVTHADGSFQMTSYTANDGAPAGEYIVTVFWPNHDGPCDDLMHDRLCGAYADRTKSQLHATVRPDGRNEITIQATVGSRGWNLPRTRDAGATAADRANAERGK